MARPWQWYIAKFTCCEKYRVTCRVNLDAKYRSAVKIMNWQPKISVLMPVYNGERYVEKAIESVLRQEFTDFELIIVDDGSTDNSLPICKRCATHDKRIRLIVKEKGGTTSALKQGFALAKGEFVARMDADDISLPQRFNHQLSFMKRNVDVAVVGTQVELIDPDGLQICVQKHPTHHEEIYALMMNGGYSMVHPTVMMRKEIIESAGGYRGNFEMAQDYDLWLRIAEQAKLANLPMVLLRQRLHDDSVSYSKRDEQYSMVMKALKEARRRRGIPLDKPVVPAKTGPFNKRCYWSRLAHRSGNYSNARKLAVKALKRSPSEFEAWRVVIMAMLGRKAKLVHRALIALRRGH
jgi:glycosyltransferase involved in cell wall biosynthesis